MKEKITVSAIVDQNVSKVWEAWNKPEHIINWNFAADEWCCPSAESDFKEGGKFTSRMEARDGSMGFDFWGIYDVIKENEQLDYTMGDGRKVWITFEEKDGKTHIIETFEAESENSLELQKGGWQAILNNFKSYAETL